MLKKIELCMIEDSHGNTEWIMVDDASDHVTVQLFDKKKKPLIFDDACYHLREWCEKHNFTYRHTSKHLTINVGVACVKDLQFF